MALLTFFIILFHPHFIWPLTVGYKHMNNFKLLLAGIECTTRIDWQVTDVILRCIYHISFAINERENEQWKQKILMIRERMDSILSACLPFGLSRWLRFHAHGAKKSFKSQFECTCKKVEDGRKIEKRRVGVLAQFIYCIARGPYFVAWSRYIFPPAKYQMLHALANVCDVLRESFRIYHSNAWGIHTLANADWQTIK